MKRQPNIDRYSLTLVKKPFPDYDKNVYYHFYFDADKELEKRKEIYTLVKSLEEELKEKLREQKSFFEQAKYTKYFELNFDVENKLMAYSKKVKDIEDEIRYASYSCLVTSYISSSEKAFCLYQNRDFAEKLIRILKDNEEMDVVRSHDYAHFYGELFVQFIGLILRNEITQRTTALRNKTKDKKKYTTSNIIREVSCLNAVKFTDGLYVDTNSLNSDQKEVLKALDISHNTLKKYLNLFNKSF